MNANDAAIVVAEKRLGYEKVRDALRIHWEDTGLSMLEVIQEAEFALPYVQAMKSMKECFCNDHHRQYNVTCTYCQGVKALDNIQRLVIDAVKICEDVEGI